MGSAALISVLCRQPASVNNDRSPFNLAWIRTCKLIFERKFAALVTVERVQHIEAITIYAVYFLYSGDEHFFGEIELTQQEVGLESMINGELFVGHSPPREVHLLPRGAIGDRCTESVMAF